MRAVRFLPRARAQLRDIHTHIARGDAIAARAFMMRVEEAAGLIARNPAIGQLVSRRGVRRFPLAPYPYLIYYRTGRIIQILCVLHATRLQPRFHEPASGFVEDAELQGLLQSGPSGEELWPLTDAERIDLEEAMLEVERGEIASDAQLAELYRLAAR